MNLSKAIVFVFIVFPLGSWSSEKCFYDVTLRITGLRSFDGFASAMNEAIRVASTKVAQGVPMHKVMEGLAAARGRIASGQIAQRGTPAGLLEQRDLKKFTKWRIAAPDEVVDGFSTNMQGPYARYVNEASDYVKKNRPDWREWEGDLPFTRIEKIPETGEEIRLTTVWARVSESSYSTSPRWVHTSEHDVPKILRHCKRLFGQAKKASTKQELVRRAAELHWWLSHAIPFRRGSASVNDAFIKSIFAAKNIPFPKWRPDIRPDVIAFHTSREDFVARYSSFVEGGFLD